MCVMFMIRNAEGLYWNINKGAFRESAYATVFESKFRVYKHIRENEDAFGTDHLIVEEVICL